MPTFPARQRKRLQVGTTNLTRCNSVVKVDGLSSPGHAELHTFVGRTGETSATLVKGSRDSPHRQSPAVRSYEPGKMAPVLRTEIRRLRALSPNNSSRSSGEHQHINKTPWQKHNSKETTNDMEVPELRFGGNDNNIREATSGESQSPIASHHKKDNKTIGSKEKLLLTHNRAKLYDVFMEKYGSMRAVFRAFDNDGNGMISAQRFRDMIEAAEVDLSPNETCALYRTADVNGDNTVAFQEFVQMFSQSNGPADAPVSSAYSPMRDSSGLTRDPSSSVAIKFRTPLELSPRSRRRMKQLRKQVTDELGKKHGTAIGVRGGKPDQLLAYAFKNVDSDNDGLLSYSEVEHALGRGFLKLEDAIPAGEMREMLHLMDRNGDEQISLREFVHYFAVGERDVATNLIDNGRKKELAALHAKRTVELTPRDVVDPVCVERSLAVLQLEESAPDSARRYGMCLPEQLNKRTAAIINTGKGTTYSSDKTNKEFALSSSSSSLQLEIDRRPVSSCSVGGPVVAVLSPVSLDRFYHRRHERTDWTRVGVGGDGIRTDAGMYLSPQERFATTTGEAYSPISRAPSSAKGDGNAESFAMIRAGKSSTTMEEEARRSRRIARYERTQVLMQKFEGAHTQAERLKDWKFRANTRKTAGERFSYLDNLQDREQKVGLREDGMQRRHGGANFLRMWAGSAESQFNDH